MNYVFPLFYDKKNVSNISFSHANLRKSKELTSSSVYASIAKLASLYGLITGIIFVLGGKN